MEQTICVNAPLVLAGTRNTRELGGYPAACGRKTRRHAFLRSDGLSGLTDKDVQMLLDYGVCCVVDLRSESETAAAPSPSCRRTRRGLLFHPHAGRGGEPGLYGRNA